MKRFTFLITVMAFSLGVLGTTVEKTFNFGKYTVEQSGDYQMISFVNTMLTGLPGEPVLPYQAVSLMLPPGEVAVSVEFIGQDEVILPGFYKLLPQQNVQPLSKGKSGQFIMNKAVYSSNGIYPAQPEGKLITSFMNGFGFALSSFTPVRYNPFTGQVSYYKSVTYKIITRPGDAARQSLTNLTTNKSTADRVARLAQNPEMMMNYSAPVKRSSGYQMLIIVPAAYQASFTQLTDKYLQEGIKSSVVTRESIVSSMTGADVPEKIRNFIIQEYQSNGIEYVLLGGDVELMPYRGFYCFVQSSSAYEDDDIPSDLYYSALDGNWNTNNDSKWGEPGEDDLLPEVAVARLPFSNQSELAAMLNKTIKYQFSPVTGELHNPLLAGENLYSGPDTWGSDYLELLIGLRTDNGYTTNGIPSTQSISRMYDETNTWSGSDLIAELNQGHSFLHHAGHANQTYVMKLSNSDITNSNFSGLNGVTHNYTLVYTHGCDCGSFDYDDCIGEKMVTINNFAAAFIGNTRYGWFNEGQTEGPSAHLQREFVDAMFTDKLNRLGVAHMESKAATAPWVTAPGQWEPGAIRWCFYDCNVMGDPAMAIWADEPMTLSVNYLAAIPLGNPSLTVTVTGNGSPAQGLNCTLLKNGVMHGTAVSDGTGTAVINFDPAVNELGTAQLVVSGYNCLPTTYTVTFIENTGAFVVYASSLATDAGGNNNGMVEYGEPIKLTVGMKNLGMSTAQNVSVKLRTSDPFVTLTDTTEQYGTIAAGATVSMPDGFAFAVAPNIPDNHEILFSLKAEGSSSWMSAFTISAYAPFLNIGTMTIDDNTGGNGNGKLDPGETAVLHIHYANAGHSDALNTSGTLTTGNTNIQITNPVFTIGNLSQGASGEELFTVVVSGTAPIGMSIGLTNILSAGLYADTSNFTPVVGQIDEDFETGNFHNYDWVQGGNVPWSISTALPFEGSDCAASGAITNNQTTELSITFNVLSADSISFYRKVSSEDTYDFLRFYLDNTKVAEWSGIQDWARFSCPVSAGIHIFRWSYEKDITVAEGLDAAWIDYIVFPPVTLHTSIDPVAASSSFSIYPNPASGRLAVNYHLSVNSAVKLTLCDIAGRELMVLAPSAERSAGEYTELTNVSAVKPGIYLIKMQAGNNTLLRKVIVK